ncbi:MAG: hypothetical protein LBR65_07485 [Culturomica sp.]|jgi:hypothetical protein|nr:hypothetical protein [Culturomica sp.]
MNTKYNPIDFVRDWLPNYQRRLSVRLYMMSVRTQEESRDDVQYRMVELAFCFENFEEAFSVFKTEHKLV